jgi:membrane protein DedA with SNARE-associated domain
VVQTADVHGLFGHASLPLITLLLLLGGFGLPIPEDPALIAAGALSAKGVVPIWLSAACCIFGVLAGDLMLFLGARHLGPAVKKSRPFKAIGAERQQKIDDLLMRRGWLMVFLARHVMGIRAVTFALAGMHHMKVRTFLIADTLAFAITGPLWWGLGYFFASKLEELSGAQRIEHVIMIGALVVTAGYVVYAVVRNKRRTAAAIAAPPTVPTRGEPP